MSSSTKKSSSGLVTILFLTEFKKTDFGEFLNEYYKEKSETLIKFLN